MLPSLLLGIDCEVGRGRVPGVQVRAPTFGVVKWHSLVPEEPAPSSGFWAFHTITTLTAVSHSQGPVPVASSDVLKAHLPQDGGAVT